MTTSISLRILLRSFSTEGYYTIVQLKMQGLFEIYFQSFSLARDRYGNLPCGQSPYALRLASALADLRAREETPCLTPYGNFACGEYLRALRLTSKLVDLRAANANSCATMRTGICPAGNLSRPAAGEQAPRRLGRRGEPMPFLQAKKAVSI